MTVASPRLSSPAPTDPLPRDNDLDSRPASAPTGSSAHEPIIAGFFPDPTICRVGEDYYLATSSFEYFPGAPLFHSRDIVQWTQIGNILDRRAQFSKGDGRPSGGIYGSTLRHHHDMFYFVTTNVSSFESGQLLVTASNPEGPWSDPVVVSEAVGIDPDLCWDDDGVAYLTWNALDFATGGDGILQAPIDLITGQLLEQPYPVWQGSGLPAAEGPHLYRADDYWYILLAEGGTERGHCVTIARGLSPRGPFEACPANPILTRRSTFHPVQNAGHADLVERADGSWVAVYLGVRPQGPTPGFHVLGRETFLAGVDWVDGWPHIVEDAFDIPLESTGFFDAFSGELFHPRWVVPASEPDVVVAHRAQGGGLALAPSHSGSLCTRVRDLAWDAQAVVVDSGAFRLRIDDRHWYEVVLSAGQVTARARIGDLNDELGRVSVSDRDEVTLTISAREPRGRKAPFGDAGPDEIVLGVRMPSGFTELARLDGRYLSTEVASGFTGRMLAISGGESGGLVRSIQYTPHRGAGSSSSVETFLPL